VPPERLVRRLEQFGGVFAYLHVERRTTNQHLMATSQASSFVCRESKSERLGNAERYRNVSAAVTLNHSGGFSQHTSIILHYRFFGKLFLGRRLNRVIVRLGRTPPHQPVLQAQTIPTQRLHKLTVIVTGNTASTVGNLKHVELFQHATSAALKLLADFERSSRLGDDSVHTKHAADFDQLANFDFVHGVSFTKSRPVQSGTGRN